MGAALGASGGASPMRHRTEVPCRAEWTVRTHAGWGAARCRGWPHGWEAREGYGAVGCGGTMVGCGKGHEGR